MTVTFCGHKEIYDETAVRHWLRPVIQNLICNGADLFLLGGYGSFDRIAASIVREEKTSHPEVQSVLVLPYLDRKFDAGEYDSTTYPPLESVPKQHAITHRNRWMVDHSDVVVAYVTHSWGGAASTLKYAIQKKKEILQFKGVHT